jgi:thymidylate kinase
VASGDAESTRRELAGTINDCAHDRVLVFGSLPPRGGDLDLLARPPELTAIERTLASRGFMQRGLKWAHFDGCATFSVDLVPAEQWGLAQAEMHALFAEADPLEEFPSLAVPSPHHQILIAARRAARAGGNLDDRSRARVSQALARDPSAWSQAEQRASAWNAPAAMRLLGALWPSLDGDQRSVKTAARLEFARSVAKTPGGWRRLASRGLRSRQPALVAFSGLDGAGKSFQAKALQESLTQLGVETFVVWPPAQNVLFQLPPTIKGVLLRGLERVGRVGHDVMTDGAPPQMPRHTDPAGSSAIPASGGVDGPEPHFPDLPSQGRLVVHLLATIVALVQVLSLRTGASSAPGRPRVVIFDRYTLDAIVYVRHRWGQGRSLRWQCSLISALARQPGRAYLLEVAPAVAYARKQDFPLETLRGRANLYREQWQALGVTRLDGERPPAELCEEIARDVWSLLA